MNKLVSINHVITNLIDDLGLDHNKYKPMFVNWATQAERHIDSFYAKRRKIAVLTISGCVADLPCDATHLEIALLGDHGCDCGDLMVRAYNGVSNVSTTTATDSNGFLVIDLPAEVTTGAGWGLVKYAVQDNKIILNRNCDAQKLTVQYLGREVDEDGIPKIGENHISAINEYCMFKFRSRRIRSGFELGLVRDHERRWHQLCADARATDAALTDSDQKSISDIINNPLAGRGLPLVNSWNSNLY